jgi:hypothetical protein
VAEFNFNSLSAEASEASLTVAQSDVTLSAWKLKKAEEAYTPIAISPTPISTKPILVQPGRMLRVYMMLKSVASTPS